MLERESGIFDLFVDVEQEQATDTIDMAVDAAVSTQTEFDLDAFFQNQTIEVDPVVQESEEDGATNSTTSFNWSEFHTTATQSAQTFIANFSTERFSKGSELAANTLGAIGTLFGSCGAVCLHTIGSVASAGSAAAGAGAGLGPGLFGSLFDSAQSEDEKSQAPSLISWGDGGSFGGADSTSSSNMQLDGSTTDETTLFALYSSGFERGIACLFGFGLISMLVDFEG